MARRHRFIVTYDITHPKRLRRVFTTMKTYGEPLQYSVFRCDLSRTERLALQTDLEAIVKTTEDSIMFVDLGEATDEATLRVSYLGQRRATPDTTQATIL